MLLLSLLVACGGKTSTDDTGTPTTEDHNPIVPAEYEYLWDTDVSSCDGADAIVYYLFAGETDGAGTLTGTEGWYWFFATEGWDGDCVDTFTVEGSTASHSWDEDACYGCEAFYDSRWDLPDENRGCTDTDYETFWEQEDVDKDRFDVEVGIDALTPSGNPNTDNKMIVATIFQGSDNTRWVNAGYARGHYLPVTEGDYEGPATLDWVAQEGICVTITTVGGG